MTLDLESAVGRNRFKGLAASDIVLESSEPGYLDGLGLGYEDLSKLNPAIVITSIPFGQTGPYAHYEAADIVAWSMGGMAVAGRRRGPPSSEDPGPHRGGGVAVHVRDHRRWDVGDTAKHHRDSGPRPAQGLGALVQTCPRSAALLASKAAVQLG